MDSWIWTGILNNSSYEKTQNQAPKAKCKFSYYDPNNDLALYNTKYRHFALYRTSDEGNA